MIELIFHFNELDYIKIAPPLAYYPLPPAGLFIRAVKSGKKSIEFLNLFFMTVSISKHLLG